MGSRCRFAKATRCRCSPPNIGVDRTVRASTRAFVVSENARSMSAGRLASTKRSSRPSASAAVSAPFRRSCSVRAPDPPGCQRTATRRSDGTACLNSSRRLPTSSGRRSDRPVTLPPGCARLATMPLVTGSAAPMKTIGTRLVALPAAIAGSAPAVTMTSTLLATSSAASASSRSGRPCASRNSITRLRPSRPRSCSPRRKDSVNCGAPESFSAR